MRFLLRLSNYCLLPSHPEPHCSRLWLLCSGLWRFERRHWIQTTRGWHSPSTSWQGFTSSGRSLGTLSSCINRHWKSLKTPTALTIPTWPVNWMPLRPYTKSRISKVPCTGGFLSCGGGTKKTAKISFPWLFCRVSNFWCSQEPSCCILQVANFFVLGFPKIFSN